MTATPHSPTLALCVICHERPDELRDALESAPGFDEVVVLDMASTPPLTPVPGSTWMRSDENRGVTSGRNQLAAAATADVLVFLDDDAVFTVPDPAGAIRSAFRRTPGAGAIAFRITRADGAIVKAEFPFRGPVRNVDRARPCAYFLGGAVAIDRAAYLDSGGFDERYLYSTEEIDLGFALARLGRSCEYDPSISVEHRPSKRGRALDPQVPALRLRNRILLARRNLPAPVGAVHVAAWAGRTFVEAARAGRVSPWLRAWREGFALPVRREPLPYGTLVRLNGVGGRVLW